MIRNQNQMARVEKSVLPGEVPGATPSARVEVTDGTCCRWSLINILVFHWLYGIIQGMIGRQRGVQIPKIVVLMLRLNGSSSRENNRLEESDSQSVSVEKPSSLSPLMG